MKKLDLSNAVSVIYTYTHRNYPEIMILLRDHRILYLSLGTSDISDEVRCIYVNNCKIDRIAGYMEAWSKEKAEAEKWEGFPICHTSVKAFFAEYPEIQKAMETCECQEKEPDGYERYKTSHAIVWGSHARDRKNIQIGEETIDGIDYRTITLKEMEKAKVTHKEIKAAYAKSIPSTNPLLSRYNTIWCL